MNQTKHPKDMTREELLGLVYVMSWDALDLAQHLHFAITMLNPEFQEAAFKKAAQMALDLAFYYAQNQYRHVFFPSDDGYENETELETMYRTRNNVHWIPRSPVTKLSKERAK